MKVQLIKLKCLIALLYLFFIMIPSVYGQDNILEDMLNSDSVVTGSFNYGLLINNQTTETTSKGSFQLRIQHRFGELDLKRFGKTVVQDFLGFDGSANIRFGFTFAATDNFQIGLGRTKIDKVYDIEGKYKVLKQKENRIPISLTIFFNTAISSVDFPEVGPSEFFADGVTPFEYKFAHRLAYNGQIIISRKFDNRLSLLVSPMIIYKNLVAEGRENLILGANLGARYKTGITSSIVFEFTTKFNNRLDGFNDPIALGYEIGTAGHAFQMFIATSNQIIPQNLFYSNPLDYSKGRLVLGFNIKRTFRNANN